MKTTRPNYALQIGIIILLCIHMLKSTSELQAIEKIFSRCKKSSPEFDACMKVALNNLQPYFKRGIPEIGVAPFDPHIAKEVKQKRTLFGIEYTLILRNVYERGWTKSTVTKFKTDWVNESIIYSQYFPEKSLEGQYEFKIVTLRSPSAAARAGRWNLTLRDYAQSTRVARGGAGAGGGGGVAVRVEVDRIGDMDMHITNLLRGRTALEQLLDSVINAFWKPGFTIVRPMINDLVSIAFTDIWSESFKNLDVSTLFKD